MADRSWFYAADGQQQGPFPEAQLRDLIVRGTVRADTLVWTEGMSGWQRAGEIPGLAPGGSGPPVIPQAGGPVMSAGSYGGGALSIDLPLWPLLGRTILYVIGFLLVIPAPWVATSYYRWMASRTSVPGRPNFAFNGKVGDIWYVFVALALMSYAGQLNNYLPIVAVLIEAFLSWMILRWIAGNLSSNGQPLPIAFNGIGTGSALAHAGFQHRLCVPDSDSMGAALVREMVRVAIRAGRARLRWSGMTFFESHPAPSFCFDAFS